MRPSTHSRVYAVGLSGAAILAVIFAGVYCLVYRGPQEVAVTAKNESLDALSKGYDLARRVGADIRDALQLRPKVVVGERTIMERSSDQAELVTISQVLEHTHTFEHNWAGSTKRLEIKGVFMAKAGFSVDGLFAIRVSEDGSVVSIQHGPPRIISCELQEVIVVKDENGYWNKLTVEDRQNAQNALIQGARKAAADSGLFTKASENLRKRLEPLEAKHGVKLQDTPLP